MVQIFLVKSGRRNLGEKLPIPTTWFWSTELVRIRCSLRLRGTLAGVLPVTFPLQRTLAEAPPATLPLMWERNLLHLKTKCVSDRHFTVRIREVLKSVSHVVKDICQEFSRVCRVLTSAFHWAEWGQCGDICDARDDTKGGHCQCLLVIWRCSNVLTYDALEPSAGGRRCPLWIEHN